jgi:small-conductance mechanosensitive channel
MDYVSNWIQETLGLGPGPQLRIVNSLIAVIVLWIIHGMITRLLVPRVEDLYVRYRTRKITGYILVLIGLLVVGRIWIEGFQSLATYLGILSAGLAIALRDPLVNLAGWFFIIWRRPFDVRDRVQIGQHAGDVIDIRIFSFTLMEIGNWVDADQSTGRVIHIPNGKVFSEAVANYSRGFNHIWNEIPVLITFESNWEKAKEILLRIVKDHAEAVSETAARKVRQAARKYMIFYRKLTPTVYTSVRESGVQLTIRYLCEPRRRRTTSEAIWQDVLREFAGCEDIEFAYPTRRYFDNLTEGKPGVRPAPPGGGQRPGA